MMDSQSISEEKCFSFMWVLENFSFSWHKKGERISSPTFIADTIERTKWKLVLYPNGVLNKNNDSISFYLAREEDSKGPTDLTIFFELSFLASDGSVLKSSGIFEYSFSRDKSGGFEELVKKELFRIKRKQFLPKDNLTTRCRMWKKHGQITQDRQCLARTRIGIERRSFVWTVSEFSTFQKNTFFMKSILDDTPIMSLNLLQTNRRLIHLQILLKDLRVKYSVFYVQLLDAFRNRVECYKNELIFALSDESVLYPLSFSKEKLRRNKNLYLPDDTLTLNCECTFTTGIVTHEIEKIICGCPPLTQEGNLSDDDLESKNTSLDFIRIFQQNLKSLYKDNIFCDVKLKTKSGIFPAHKNILSARSSVFKAMFTYDMKERNTECVYMEDLSDDTVRRMLFYIYTATVQDLQWESASHLYTAANKYKILSLKNKCSSFLKDNLCPDNACNLLIFADMHQDHNLKSAAQNYILNHRGIFSTSEWKLFMKTNVQLAADLMFLKLKD